MPHVLRPCWAIPVTFALFVGCSFSPFDLSSETPMSDKNQSDLRETGLSPDNADNRFASITDAEWKQRLTPEQYYVTRQQGTERSGSSQYVHWEKHGVFTCVCCGQPVFASDDKFDSGTGWPSFTRPIDEENVGTRSDNTFFMRRTEVHCSRCGAHLGHVFSDGPQPTGLRYCMNGVAMSFEEGEERNE